MIVTKYQHYTTDELIRLALNKSDLTQLEKELLKRLMAASGWEG